MTLQRIVLDGTEFQGKEKLEKLIEGCALLDAGIVKQRFESVADILLANVSKLDLHEDEEHLSAFARCIACEIISNEARLRHYGGACWKPSAYRNFPPFYKKSEEPIFPWSKKLSRDEQGLILASMLTYALKDDPKFEADALAMLLYISSI
ncbi:hypothetical protein ACO0LL_29890 [Undibacterium sp. TC4M20W]|uniref:hypothetical protein n=1 Tax=unclassified Undibacterium TaxID=2630295 RepID=UPI003BF04CE0